jgi:hypothetical protein
LKQKMTTWSLLKGLALQEPTNNYISHLYRMKNVRDAITAIIIHYKGELELSQTKVQAYEMIKKEFYSGEKQICRFKMKDTLHQKCHQFWMNMAIHCYQQNSLRYN